MNYLFNSELECAVTCLVFKHTSSKGASRSELTRRNTLSASRASKNHVHYNLRDIHLFISHGNNHPHEGYLKSNFAGTKWLSPSLHKQHWLAISTGLPHNILLLRISSSYGAALAIFVFQTVQMICIETVQSLFFPNITYGIW
jgi:hypothetical protein